MKHTEAREEALGALYGADTRGLDVIDITKISLRAAELAEGAWDRREEIDGVISHASSHWRIERMPVVDRNILRIGVYELTQSDLPVGIVISEAVELAKKYSTAKSGAFVNGVLSAVADTVEDSESAEM
ncbi:MAG: transcription antitermination factor NusB [Actinomycetota bacterium]|nr:transcription antitermination factor NusB [Actinomycetota bacterium]